jgi:hypothetical protein
MPVETHGVPVRIDWAKFRIGSSFFVPGLDTQGLQNQIRKYAAKFNMRVVVHRRIERDVIGVRVWRIP